MLIIYLRDLETNEWKKFDKSDKSSLEQRNIIIGKDVRIGKNTCIDNNVTICDESYIGKEVKIGRNTFIGFHSFIGHRSEIGNDVHIRHNSHIGLNAKINDKETPTTIHINGAENIYYWGEEIIVVGRFAKTFDYWLSEKGLRMFKERYNFTEKQVEEYVKYIFILKSIYEAAKENK